MTQINTDFYVFEAQHRWHRLTQIVSQQIRWNKNYFERNNPKPTAIIPTKTLKPM
jgi:hypothetical protein